MTLKYFNLQLILTAISKQKESPSVSHLAITLDFLGRMANFFRLASQRHQQRHQLKNLTLAQLDDMGISREQALSEAKKHFWK